MAKRMGNTKFKREKKPRVTRTQEYITNIQYLGEEPKFAGELVSDLELSKAFTWYSYMCTASDARDYIVEYMEHIGKKNVARLVKQLKDGRVPTTAGWLCRIMMRGGKIADRSKEFLLDRVTRALERQKQSEVEEKDEKEERQPVDVQAAVRERARDIIGDFESMIDKNESFDTYEYMQKKNIPAVYSSYISTYYQKMVDEITDALKADVDEDLKFAYRRYGKAKLAKLLAFYTAIVDGADKYAENTKRVRKANRKPKTVSVEKLIKNRRYQKNDNEFKLVSVDPQQILAAQELWTFNTKNRMLTVYRAQDQGGLGVKTVSVIGFSESTSISKRLRKPEEVLQKVLSGGKVVLRELMDSLKTKPAPIKGRLTRETILLRAVK